MTTTLDVSPDGKSGKKFKMPPMMPQKKDKGGSAYDPNARYDYGSPVRPSLLLLPGFVQQGKSRDALIRKVATAGVAVVVLLVAMFGGLLFLKKDAESKLDDALATEQSLTNENRALLVVADYFTGIAAGKTAVETALAADLAYSKALNDAAARASAAGVTLTSIKTNPGVKCIGPSPFTPRPAIGCLDLAGEAVSPAEVSRFLGELQKSKILLDPYLSSFGQDGGFAVSVNYNKGVYSNRYLNKENPITPPADVQIAGAVPAAPAPADAAVPATTPGG